MRTMNIDPANDIDTQPSQPSPKSQPSIAKKLSEDRAKHLQAIKLIDETLENLRALCGESGHNWIPDGNDSHYDYEKCTYCGERRRI
jgi:hypothetical protein